MDKKEAWFYVWLNITQFDTNQSHDGKEQIQIKTFMIRIEKTFKCQVYVNSRYVLIMYIPFKRIILNR